VRAALDKGANAIEPDVNAYADRPNELCIGEASIIDPDYGCEPDAPSLAQYLDALHGIALQRPELALVVFDCKPKIATPELGLALRTEVRNRLTFDTGLNAVFSVSDRSQGAFFDRIRHDMGPREGLMIDEENDPVAISSFFGDVPNRCFGNGIAVASSLLGPNVRPSMERACEYRAASGLLRFIYVWSVNEEDGMREYLRIGVDGFITDNLPMLNAVLQEDEFRNAFRNATRLDNPFLPANFAYGIAIYTGDQEGAGTDAQVKVTLSGGAGDASEVLNGCFPGRLERNSWTYVTLPTADLGELRSVTIQRDDDGIAADWYLDRVEVRSSRFGTSKTARFNQWICAAESYARIFE
jgi:hypothetical protein